MARTNHTVIPNTVHNIVAFPTVVIKRLDRPYSTRVSCSFPPITVLVRTPYSRILYFSSENWERIIGDGGWNATTIGFVFGNLANEAASLVHAYGFVLNKRRVKSVVTKYEFSFTHLFPLDKYFVIIVILCCEQTWKFKMRGNRRTQKKMYYWICVCQKSKMKMLSMLANVGSYRSIFTCCDMRRQHRSPCPYVSS